MNAPQTIGSYLLEERFAVGGMAEIFRARRQGPGGFSKRVAVKRLLPHLSHDPEFVAMFLEEARLASQVSSPNLVEVFDFGAADGAYFLAMEYVDGVDLAGLLCATGALPADLALYVGIELCRGLEALHAAKGSDGVPLGIVHRDVTPGNVLASLTGEVKLGDFGIAKSRARALRTEGGAIKGKLAYLTPEQVRGDEVDARTDLYGAGLVVFELFTGERFLPFLAEAQMLAAARQPRWRDPSSLRSGISTAIDELVRRALSVDPAQRFPSATHFRQALEGLAPDLKNAAGRLGELVARAHGRHAPPQVIAPATVTPFAPLPPTDPAGPRTERLAPGSAGRRRVLWGALAAVSICATGFWLALRPPQPVPPPADPPPTSLPVRALAPADATATSLTNPEPQPPPADKPPVRVTAHAVQPKSPVSSPPEPISTDPAPTPAPVPPARPTFDAEIAALDSALAGRGLLAADAPDLFAARRDLGAAAAKGDATAEQITELRGRIEAFPIDRAFLEKKTLRLNTQIEKATLSETTRQDLVRREGVALSHLMNGRHPQANAELNAIAALLAK